MELDRCYQGDCRRVMRSLIADGVRVQCIVTSPPYWGLRDYGVDGQLGLEASLPEFITSMVEVFDLCRQLLTDDGTLWLNMGDSYAGTRGAAWGPSPAATEARAMIASRRRDDAPIPRSDVRVEGLKPKDLVGQPWRLAFALQDAGWWLRQDIIWHKPNPMPESVRDRCTKAHEYLFLMTKSEKYFYDQQAVLEPVSSNTHARLSQDVQAQVGSTRANGGAKTNGNMKAVGRTPAGWATGTDRKHEEIDGRYTAKRKVYPGTGVGFGRGYDAEPKPRVKNNASFNQAMAIMPTERNRRSVWTIPTQSYSGAHFATFPEALVEPCILAGSRPGDIVFDPFMGSGTVASVAQRLGRRWLGAELNPDYISLQTERTRQPGLVLEAPSV
ncbi:DNA modification methylase [Cupriavidus metallidurans]|jgi:site-specific DNA-methyltransferase (cytosine-N4-specific)|uniref:DNA-methyltransferase n=1 Tax=Cupriavidus TaxID=106589 RepID=UPI000493951E|nr:site-specific DNA-methyltransferase [Cupriavidus metallidurans]KWW37881.1 Modification methylase DpnIIB [Cupriavidus metallidurans]MDE4918192.1 site-specific DNA-methyltransferase [Cupriavidus metallidurans]